MVEQGAVIQIGQYAQDALVADQKVTFVDGIPFGTVPLHDLRKKDPEPDTLVLHSLSALSDYIEVNRDGLPLEDLALHVVSPTQVDLVSNLHGQFQQRTVYVSARATSAVAAGHLGFAFGRWLDKESMNIALQALFVDAFDRAKVLKLIGTVTTEANATTKDDGVTQKVEVKAGIQLVGTAEVPNPVTLAPHRTFPEVVQVESPFVLRLRAEGAVQAALFEADGGLWAYRTVQLLAAALREMVDGKVVVLA